MTGQNHQVASVPKGGLKHMVSLVSNPELNTEAVPYYTKLFSSNIKARTENTQKCSTHTHTHRQTCCIQLE